MTIAIIVPTRRRKEQLKRMIASAHATTKDIAIYVGYTKGDETEFDGVVFPDGLPTVHKWNLMANEAMKDHNVTHVMLGADDVIFSTPCWDEALMEKYDGKPHVYHLRDSRDPDGTPHPIVTREYIEAMGFFLPPIFLHWFVDSWTVDIARANECFTHLTDYMLIHDKPSDKGHGDETFNGIRNMGWHDRDTWTASHSQDVLEMYKLKLKEKING